MLYQICMYLSIAHVYLCMQFTVLGIKTALVGLISIPAYVIVYEYRI